MADHVRAADLERVQQGDRVDRHALDRVAHSRRIALPDAAMIEGDHFEPLGEGRDLLLPK